MEKFIAYLLQYGHLTAQQIEQIVARATELTLLKDGFFWEAGKRVKQTGFITEGVLRVYYPNDKGEEITRYFIDENHLILPGGPGSGVYTASEYLSAVTDCKMVVFTQANWQQVSDTITGWNTIVQKIITQHHGEKIERRSKLVALDGTERYLNFIEQFPTLANRVPLSYIASYLGLTQSSLSRIRKNIR